MSTRPLALISVYDKTGVADFARGLAERGYEILSTGGTRRAIEAAGVAVTPVSAFTGAPELFSGRVKTLHPMVHGGILARAGQDEAESERHGVRWIAVVAVNLYPFEATVSGGAGMDEAMENVDIGGPCMVRAAAKNHARVTVVTDPADYPAALEALDADNPALRARLAVKAFRHTAAYDAVISSWLTQQVEDPPELTEGALPLRRIQALRYGENPHQQAAFYAEPLAAGRSLARATQLQGKALSYNNLSDLDGCLRAAFDFEGPACVISKHGNPCGAATHPASLSTAYELALSADPVSAFGSIVAFNRPIGAEEARAIGRSRLFIEVLAAPGVTDEAPRRRRRQAGPGRLAAPGLGPRRPRRVAGGHKARPHRRRGRRPALRLARRAPRQVQRHRLREGSLRGPRRRRGAQRRRRRPDVPGGRGEARRDEGHPRGPGLHHGLRRLLPLPRRPRGRRAGRHHRHHPARRLGQGRRGHRRRRRRRPRHGDDRQPPLPPLVPYCGQS
jgi:phosphoribosylaminoimidazolecarboxamide formyltransferase/IMP cyclohydrolase